MRARHRYAPRPMSNLIPSRPRPFAMRHTFAIVASRYNAEFVDGMVEGARKELEIISPQARVKVHEVPGSFEIPLAVQAIAERGGVDAILTFGLIWEGETRHADLIATSVTKAILDLSLRFKIPILHEVLVVKNEEQARARCLGELNRGIEAARASVRMLQTMSELKGR